MAYIKIKLDAALMDGHNVTFKAPCDCTAIEGLKVCYIENNSLQEKTFSMKDTHGNTLAGLGNLFAAGSYVHAILDSVNLIAYLQNAATNGYLEGKLKAAEAAITADHAAIEELVNNQIPEEYLQACVDDYINENGSGLATKEEVNALDAKISGEMEDLNSSLSSEIAYGLIETNNVVFEIGSIHLTTGENNSRTDRIRTGFIPVADKQTINLGAVYKWNVWQYDENYNFIAVDSEAWKEGQEIDVSVYDCAYVKVALLYSEIIYDCTITRIYRVLTIDEKIDNLAQKAELKKEYLKGKKVSFYGDSISSFAGWIPSGNRVYYNGSNNGVNDVSQTWWKMLVDHYNMELVVNNSWSGRCVTSKRDTEEGNLNSGGYALDNISQLRTAEKEPEIIIIKLGVNDFLRLGESLPFGEYDGHSEITEDSVSFKGAYALMMKRICETFPNAKVFCCTVNQFARSESGTFPQIRENVNLVEFNNAIIETASLFGAEVIRHDLCGITYFNSNVYMGDWNGTTGLHPNALGHELIGKLTIDYFKDREI